MKSGRKLIGIFAMAALVATGLAQAQQGPPPPPGPGAGRFAFGPGPGAGPDDAIAFLGFEEGVGGKTVTGAAFSAAFSTQSTQTLADGNQIQRSTTGSFARDSQGRTRRDLTLPSIGPWAASGKAAPHVIFINDAVAGTQYILEPDRKIARTVQRPNARHHHGGPPSGQAATGGPGAWNHQKDVVTTSLGTQTINGVAAEGTRYTRTIPAGAIGNQNPIVITTERWYSSDLQMVVLSKRSDPRTGETITQLTNIQRTEPDATLFQVPSDYTVKQGGPNALYRRNRLEQ
ncbi:MAG: hypothetical protein ABSE45_05385 [Candidatus Acidiferrales bacterium]|jgi:hypothetical protein